MLDHALPGPIPIAALFGLSPTEILRDLGYAGLVLLLLAETVFPPIPSEAILPLAGYLAERGDLHPLLVLLTSTAGSVLGAVVLYEAARRGGRPFAERFVRRAHIDPARLDDAEAWFARRGMWVVLFGRCIPGVRSVVSLPAGLLRMPRLTYLALTLVGSLAWNTLLIGAGYLLGTQWGRVSEVVGPLSTPLLVVAVAGVAGGLVWMWFRSSAARRRRAARSR
jgi:membrane protein DedA with SNARE-associated domain